MRSSGSLLAVVAAVGLAPAGPPAARLLAPIPTDEYVPAVRPATARFDPPPAVKTDDPPPARDSFAFGDRMKEWWGRTTDRMACESDHAFDHLVTPVTNPFLFEDPRASTEVRGLYLYQRVPSGQPNFGGGSAWFAGGQVRLALSPKWSVVVNKVGATGLSPGGATPFETGTALSELWLGPKWTFLRDTEFGTVAATGATFQVPLGGASAFQDTGSLSVVPYLSVAQPFLKTRLGGFLGIANGGYSFSTNRDRSDYLYLNGHVSWDVGNAQRFYPLAELTYTQVTTAGRARPFLTDEGRDLFNAGASGKGGALTGAVGGRVKLTKSLDLGGAFELPLIGDKGFMSHRFTVDLIWRY